MPSTPCSAFRQMSNYDRLVSKIVRREQEQGTSLITWTMQTSELEPAAQGIDVEKVMVPSGLRVVILSTKV